VWQTGPGREVVTVNMYACFDNVISLNVSLLLHLPTFCELNSSSIGHIGDGFYG